jgi:hypothetical protein
VMQYFFMLDTLWSRQRLALGGRPWPTCIWFVCIGTISTDPHELPTPYRQRQHMTGRGRVRFSLRFTTSRTELVFLILLACWNQKDERICLMLQHLNKVPYYCTIGAISETDFTRPCRVSTRLTLNDDFTPLGRVEHSSPVTSPMGCLHFGHLISSDACYGHRGAHGSAIANERLHEAFLQPVDEGPLLPQSKIHDETLIS